MAEERAWKPDPRCCWCGSAYVQEDFDDALFFVCPTPACKERQLTYRMLDISGRVFYIPIPRLVMLEEAIAQQQYRAICIGGDRGGGKSLGLRRIAQRLCQKYDNFSVLFLRRTFTELELNHMQYCDDEALRLGADFTKNHMTWPNNSRLRFGHCQDPKDFKNYVGAQVDLLELDQIEMFTDQQVTEIGAAVGRIRRPGWRGLLLAGENPGGPLSSFVDELFISKNRDKVRYPNYDPSKYHFIRAELDDNPWVDEDYVDFLAGLEPIKRDMYRFGNRSRFPGQFFGAFDPAQHVSAK